MPRARKPVLERSGRPELAPLEDATQRVLEQMHLDGADAESDASSYTATAADWASPVPTTKADALDRIATALAGLLGTPIP